jgi:MFS family permease
MMITVLGFITLLIRPTIGIDDTSVELYYVHGLDPAAGRWCLYLINKIFPLGYNPHIVELVGLCIWNISVSIWCSLFRKIAGQSVSIWGATLFSCMMISSPILSELLVWYLHNGIFMGYGMAALSAAALIYALQTRTNRKNRWIGFLLSGVFLTVALGFYESLMIVFLVGTLLAYFLLLLCKSDTYLLKLRYWLGALLVCGGIGLLLRSMMIQLVIRIFHLEDQLGIIESRGLHEVLQWFTPEKGWKAFGIMLRGFLIKYYIDAAVYLPITILVLAVAILLIFGFVYGIRYKSLNIILCAAGITVLPWILPILEGTVTPYRSSQYVPLLCGFAALLLCRVGQMHQVRGLLKTVGIFAAIIILYRQVYELNKWFYLDSLKYEDAKQTMEDISLYIGENYDSNMPVCVIGHYQIPQSLIQPAYSPEWSKRTKLAKFFIAGLFGEKVWEEYNTPYGYPIAETPLLSVIEWGCYAYGRLDHELGVFCDMHGIPFVADGDIGHYELARQEMKNAPSWPQEGSIVAHEDYIVVNFGNY